MKDLESKNEQNIEVKPKHFIQQIIEEDLNSGVHELIATRFPPEPNGYLHVGHAKAICLSFGLAEQFSGTCNLRMDDTNPVKEDQEYIDAIQADVAWLGFSWNGQVRHTSDYFQTLLDSVVQLIKQGDAYVCELTAEQTREYRGTLTDPGKNSPDRNRSVEENLTLLDRMRSGKVKEGGMVLRAKIDMASPNMNLRDPVLYRVRFDAHPMTGKDWCIYPTYDYAHAVSDALEQITHSLCTVEFEDHRPLYDWILEKLDFNPRPRQIEFARLNLSYTLTSKRKLKRLIDEAVVDGWDDPRMPTIAGLRRRGYTPASIRHFCELIGITKSNSLVDVSMLEYAIREDLDQNAPRALCVLDPLLLTITNYPEGEIEYLTGQRHPKNPEMGERKLPFSRTLWIERTDFMENPPKKYFRLAPGKEVRLRHAYVIKCEEVVKNEAGQVVELRCTYDVDTLGKKPEGRKVKGVIHWVSVAHAVALEVRLYDRLFQSENPEYIAPLGSDNKEEEESKRDFLENLNPTSLISIDNAWGEPALAESIPEQRFQFERHGYFCLDQPVIPKATGCDSSGNISNGGSHAVDGSSGVVEVEKNRKPVFNRIVSLKDSWEKLKVAK